MDAKSQIKIQDAIDAFLKGKIRTQQVHVNRISSMGEPCVRRLYYMRHDWDKAAVTSLRLQAIFETGNVLEPVIERIVSEVGHASKPPWRIVGSQMTTKNKILDDHQISGTIDGMLQVRTEVSRKGTAALLEKWETLGAVDIKTMSPNIYPGINCEEDLNKHPWTKKYRAQIMLYSYAHGYKRCFLLLVNKSNLYEMKLIEFKVDDNYVCELLAKANKVNRAVKAGKPPAGINQADICVECPFYAICCPPIQLGSELSVEDIEELESLLDAMKEYALMHKHYEQMERQRDAILEKYEGKNMLVGNWMILWSKSVRNYKAQAARKVEGWSKKIMPLVEAGKEKTEE
jgi:hypothetical protein